MIEGFGVHTFRMVNAKGRSKFVKFHWKPKLGLQSTLWDEALKLQAADNDYHRRDLWEAINSGKFPEWELGLQIFDERFADRQPYDVLDPTKIIPEEVLPVRIVGRLVLDLIPTTFSQKRSRSPIAPPTLYQASTFPTIRFCKAVCSVISTRRNRASARPISPNSLNAPKCPMMNFQRDGMMQTAVPKGRANYEPNSLIDHGEDGGPRECPVTGFTTFKGRDDQDEQGDKLRIRPELFADHYSQARLFWISQTDNERAHIASSFVFELSRGRPGAGAAADGWEPAECR